VLTKQIQGFLTYEVALFHVKNFFGDAKQVENMFNRKHSINAFLNHPTKQNWNVNYDKAVKIFGTEPMSVLVRKTIAAQHAELYRKGIWKTKQVMRHSQSIFLPILKLNITTTGQYQDWG